jgi:2-polyprenyl-6-hydroxyphenyl methylase / 3-demethylubiquinone-9 3-methyltransferase
MMTAAATPETAPRGPDQKPSNLDPAEVERFTRLAAEWWDPLGNFRPLHQIGPPRLAFIRDAAIQHFARSPSGMKPLSGLTALDVGCGGGLVSEPLTRMGAMVTGIDPSQRNIAIATGHAEPQGLAIDYRAARVEDLASGGEQFDIVSCLEVVEHVPDVPAFIKTCASLVKPGGLAVFSTINRNFKSWALAIVGAEYVLGWLPRGTHQWDRFVTTDEMSAYLGNAGLSGATYAGITYNPIRDEWSLGTDTAVNYIVSATRAV